MVGTDRNLPRDTLDYILPVLCPHQPTHYWTPDVSVPWESGLGRKTHCSLQDVKLRSHTSFPVLGEQEEIQ